MKTLYGILAFGLGSAAMSAQAPGPVLGAGYSAPAPLKVAPGQVITLFVRNNGEPAGRAAATELPLPTELSGYSVTLEQTFSEAIPAAIFSVYSLTNCYGVSPSVCIPLTAVTVQIPWELVANLPRSGRPENFAVLRVAYRGAAGEAFPLSPESDSVHVITTCDASGTGNPLVNEGGPCRPMVTHADGSLVTAAHPGRPGEVLILYAFGLGRTGTTIRTGTGIREPVAVTDVMLGFQVGANVSASRPMRAERPGQSPVPIYAGLTAGQVGLYQIAFQVPEVAPTTPECTATSIASNVTVSIGRQASFDGAGICVAVE